VLTASVIVLSLPRPALASDADAFYRYDKAGDYTRAVDYGSRYLTAHAGDDAFAMDLAYAYLKLDDADSVRAILVPRATYLQSHPDAASIWLALSYQDSSDGLYREAITDVDHYLRYRPDDAKAWQQRDYSASVLAPQAPDKSVLFYQHLAADEYAAAIPYGEHYLAVHPENDAFAIDLAYAYIHTKGLAAAATLSHAHAAYIASNSRAQKLLTALFYAYLNSGDTATALTYGNAYFALNPADDAFAMDLAYADLKAGNTVAARSIVSAREAYLRTHPEAAKFWLELSYRAADAKQYQQAISDVGSYLAIAPSDSSAWAQLASYQNDFWGGARNSTYAYSYYDGRFNDVFLGADQIYTLSPNRGIQPYLAVHLSEDLRSGAPGTSQIYSDDALITDFGLRQSIGENIRIFAEGGYGFGLRGQGSIPDLRYGLTYDQQWGNAPLEYTSVDLSAASYARYAGNAISYYDALHAFAGRAYRPLLGVNGGLDSRRLFGNNYIEGLYGVEFGEGKVKYRILGVEGTYLTRGTTIPTKAEYSSLRAMLVLGLSK
jgi:hypothetical protein